mmetsp:Transcript_102032/g.327388  ORF Transcript_102032/g.327388 Transcript_102032/m.327388 type:complete len:215 (+) Transcript_102032:908-1552(+)
MPACFRLCDRTAGTTALLRARTLCLRSSLKSMPRFRPPVSTGKRPCSSEWPLPASRRRSRWCRSDCRGARRSAGSAAGGLCGSGTLRLPSWARASRWRSAWARCTTCSVAADHPLVRSSGRRWKIPVRAAWSRRDRRRRPRAAGGWVAPPRSTAASQRWARSASPRWPNVEKVSRSQGSADLARPTKVAALAASSRHSLSPHWKRRPNSPGAGG